MISDSVAAALLEGRMRGWQDALGGKYNESRQSPNYWDNPGRRGVRTVVWHITDGSFTASIDWLCNPDSEASANDIINRDGVVWNIVPGAKTPWTNGPLCNPRRDLPISAQADNLGINPNWWSYTIESVGYTTRGAPGALTEPQIVSLILRTAQACMVHRLTPNREHIMRHSDFDSCTRANCPGFSITEMTDWIDATAEIVRAWRGW